MDVKKNDTISRQAALDACHNYEDGKDAYAYGFIVEERLQALPSAQPDHQEALSWLLTYYTKSFELHGRYLPNEIIGWLIADFTKEFIAERRQDD